MSRAVHLLDVGHVEFGDAILCEFDNISVLIDGARKKSAEPTFTGSLRHPPLQEQIKSLLSKNKVHVDLLVMTHCHADHIGCLTKLVANGTLTCDWALMSDPDLGFGRLPTDPDDPPVDSMPMARKLALALREEPLTDASDDELERFIEDQAGFFDEYVTMLETLESRIGDQLVLYRGPTETDSPGLTALLTHFSSVGMKIPGPSRQQLGACAEVIRDRFIDAIKDAEDALSVDAPASPAALYRTLLGKRLDADVDSSAEGSALNCQSIQLTFNFGGARMLLTGDMQFAKPGLGNEVKAMVDALAQKIADDGPFSFVKLGHHASHNAFNSTLRDKWGALLYGISTGANSGSHPQSVVLDTLKAGDTDIRWMRNDRNGRSSFRFTNQQFLDPQRGSLNDDSGPTGADAQVAPLVEIEPTTLAAPVARGDGHIEVVTRIPNVRTRVTVTIDVEPQPGGAATSFHRPAASDTRLGGGRSLPRLVFVTNPVALARNIGAAEAQHAIDLVQRAGHRLVNVSDTGVRAAASVVGASLAADASVQGVVILGGYDVVPSVALDALTPQLRSAVSFEEDDDPDDFIVWNDDIFGDRDGDELPELPVSRIPDGNHAALLLGSMTAALPPRFSARTGIRNLNRPFAQNIYDMLPGAEAIVTSDPIRHGRPPQPSLAGDILYIMLHGDYTDATSFNGEDARTRQHTAMRLPQFADRVPPIVFAGCCWGALTVDALARDHSGGALGIRGPDQSIALRCLASGANAFIGCTGAHYSPAPGEAPAYGAPMHSYFLQEILRGTAPALALLRAKQQYALHLPHVGASASDGDRMIEYKILKQFTCLGLGW